jgi:hypothetical protein
MVRQRHTEERLYPFPRQGGRGAVKQAPLRRRRRGERGTLHEAALAFTPTLPLSHQGGGKLLEPREDGVCRTRYTGTASACRSNTCRIS